MRCWFASPTLQIQNSSQKTPGLSRRNSAASEHSLFGFVIPGWSLYTRSLLYPKLRPTIDSEGSYLAVNAQARQKTLNFVWHTMHKIWRALAPDLLAELRGYIATLDAQDETGQSQIRLSNIQIAAIRDLYSYLKDQRSWKRCSSNPLYPWRVCLSQTLCQHCIAVSSPQPKPERGKIVSSHLFDIDGDSPRKTFNRQDFPLS